MKNQKILLISMLIIMWAKCAFAISFQEITVPVGTYFGPPSGVSNNGIVVGTTSLGAFRWQNGTMTFLQTPENTEWSGAAAISYDGQITVGDIYSKDGGSVIWSGNNIKSLLGKGPFIETHATSSDGSVIVGRGFLNYDEPVRWENGQITPLGYLQDDGNYGVAEDVSANGSIVVGFSSSPSKIGSFRWENGQMVRLADFGQSWCSVARAISGDGSVIVGGSLEPVYWKDDQVYALEETKSISGEAYDVSFDGKIIVGTYIGGSLPDPGWSAFIYDPVNGLQNFKGFLSNSGLNMAGWDFTQATAISPNGRYIVGSGFNPQGIETGWVVTIPEPASAVFFVGTILLIVKKRYNNGSKIKIVIAHT